MHRFHQLAHTLPIIPIAQLWQYSGSASVSSFNDVCMRVVAGLHFSEETFGPSSDVPQSRELDCSVGILY